MRRARGPSPTSPFRALAHHHASHGNGQQTPASVSSMIRSFNVETNPTRPMRPSPLTASTIKDMPLDLVDRIRSFPLFMSAPDDFLAAIGKHLRPQIHAAHDHILTEGDDAKAMYWLVRGVVAVTSRDGEAIYAELKPGAFFGEIGVLMDVPRTATIVARTKCLLVVLKKEDLQTELPHYPDMEKAIRQEAEERLTILKKKQQERRTPASSTGTSGSLGTLSTVSESRAVSAFDSSSSSASPGDTSAGDVNMTSDNAASSFNSKKRKSPSPGIIEDPAVGGSALGSGYVNVRKTLKELPLFSTLPPDILHFLGLSAQPKTYSPFSDIIRQGSSGQDIYFIVNGEAEVIHELPNGKILEAESTFARPRLSQGQYFGEVASLGLSRGRRTATVRSITSVECLMISSEALEELWRRCPPELKHQVEETARVRYNQQQAEEKEAASNASQTDVDLGDDVEMKDTDGDAGTEHQNGTDANPLVTLTTLRRASVPDVTFTTPSKPSSPTKATKDEGETRQPSDPDPFLSVDMENMRNRRRNSLAPPTPQSDSSSLSPSPSSSSSLSSASPSGPSTPLQQIQQSNDVNANSSPLKLFTFPPLTTPPPEGPLPKAPERHSASKASQDESRGPFKKARTLGRPPGSRRSGTPSTPSSASGAIFTLPFSTRQFPPEDALVSVFQRFDFLQLVRLAGVCRQWRRILLTSPQLCTHVDLSPYSSMINDWSIANIIAPFIGLRAVEIDISNCFHITDEGFQILWKRCGKNIKAWRMKSVWDVSANQILDMSENASGLEEIDWSNCRKVGDNLLARVVGWVVPQPPPTVPSNKIVAIANSNATRGRHHKDHHRNKDNKEEQPAKQGPAPGTVIGCPNLKILDLSYCKHITDRSMVHLAAHASNRLRSISLTRCTSISDAGFQAWAPYRFNQLTHLCLADCTYLSDNAIVSLVNAAKNLTHLDLSFCCALSDTATEVVALGLPMLQELRLAFCGSAVSDASLRCIALHLNDLRGLSVRGCVRVTGVGVEHVLDGCARLEWLDASQCKNLASWVVGGGIGRWGYDERAQRGRSSSSAWKTANRRSMGLDVDPAASGFGSSAGAAGADIIGALPSMRGQRRRARKPVKFIIEKGPTDGLR